MSLVLLGSTSGSVTLQEPAIAGSTVIDLPATSGTMAVSGGTITTLTTTSGISVQGLTVGRGAGAVSTNTAVGASALAANQAGGNQNTAVGISTLANNTTGSSNSAFGRQALASTTTGGANTAVGVDALVSNTTASNNTALGYQAGYSNTTGASNVIIGQIAGYTSTTGSFNTYVGREAGNLTTGGNNQFIGNGAGRSVTSGGGNSIIGNFSGNQGGLDIRTSSNYIVLSDGDGNPRYWFNGTATNSYLGNTQYVINEYRNTVDGIIAAFTIGASYDAASIGDMMIKKYTQAGYTSPRIYIVSSTNGVYLAVNGTSWASASDERMKDIIEPITDAANKVSTLRAVIGKYKTDEEGTRRSFLIAQDIQAVLPEAVDATDSEKLGVQYTDVIPLLVAAIKEQQALITQLQADVAALKGA